MTSPLRVVSEMVDNKLIEPLQSKKYQYGVALMTDTHPVSGRFVTVKADSMIEQQRMGLLPKIRARYCRRLPSSLLCSGACGFR